MLHKVGKALSVACHFFMVLHTCSPILNANMAEYVGGTFWGVHVFVVLQPKVELVPPCKLLPEIRYCARTPDSYLS